jgi:rhodanese-related sulfurtransferase
MPSKDELVAHFQSRLAFETDPSDVHADMDAAKPFVFVDVRGQSAWDQGRAKGAVHIHHSEIAERAPKEIPLDMPVVVYCWGPGCNGAHKGALNFALLGYQVKEMIGGFEYWAREGFPVEDNDGAVIRERDPLTVPVKAPSCGCS